MFISIAKLDDRSFFYVTAAMFVFFEGHEHGVSIQSSINLGDTSAKSTKMKNSRGMILGKVGYIAIIYHIPDS